MFRHIFIQSNLSVGYMTRASFIQKVLESRASRTSALAPSLPRTSSFEVQVYFHALMFLEDFVQKTAGFYSL